MHIFHINLFNGHLCNVMDYLMCIMVDVLEITLLRDEVYELQLQL
jgi:hypothetical protein